MLRINVSIQNYFIPLPFNTAESNKGEADTVRFSLVARRIWPRLIEAQSEVKGKWRKILWPRVERHEEHHSDFTAFSVLVVKPALFSTTENSNFLSGYEACFISY
jgi:hypothetical protein